MLDKPGEVLSIQALRAIAAIFVVFCHASQFMTMTFPYLSIERYFGYCFGGFGVDIFFVISGFIMVYINRDNFGRKTAILPFLTRRIIRIFPIYWLVTLVVLFFVQSGLYGYAFPNYPQSYLIGAAKDIWFVVESFLLIPAFYKGGHEIPIVGVGWTLVYEMFFYMIFSLLLFFQRTVSLKILSVTFCVLILFCFVLTNSYWNIDTHGSLAQYIIIYGNNVIFEFVLGCYIAHFYLNKKFLSSKVCWLGIVFFMVSVCITLFHGHLWTRIFGPQIGPCIARYDAYGYRGFSIGIPAAWVVYGVLSLEARQLIRVPDILVKLGDASYSIYLTHLYIVLIVVIALLKEVHTHLHWAPGNSSIFVIWASCVLLGCVFYEYIEKPLLSVLKKLVKKRWGF